MDRRTSVESTRYWSATWATEIDEENHYIIQITSTGEAKNALTSDQLVMLAEGLRW